MRKSSWIILTLLLVAVTAPNAQAQTYDVTFVCTDITCGSPDPTAPAVTFPTPTTIDITYEGQSVPVITLTNPLDNPSTDTFMWSAETVLPSVRENDALCNRRLHELGRFAGRNLGWPEGSKPSSTCGAESSGKTSAICRSSASLPCSTSCMAAAEVMALVIEAIQNTVSVLIAASSASARRPNAP